MIAPPRQLGFRAHGQQRYRIDLFDRSRLGLDLAVAGAFGAIPLAAVLQGALTQGVPGLAAVGLWMGAMWTQRDRIQLDRHRLSLRGRVEIATDDIAGFEARTVRLQGVCCYDVTAVMRSRRRRLVTTLHRAEHAAFVAERLDDALRQLRRGPAYRSPWHVRA